VYPSGRFPIRIEHNLLRWGSGADDDGRRRPRIDSPQLSDIHVVTSFRGTDARRHDGLAKPRPSNMKDNRIGWDVPCVDAVMGYQVPRNTEMQRP
jgi:hypothetical protein